MRKSRSFILFVIVCIALAACAPAPLPNSGGDPVQPQAAVDPSVAPSLVSETANGTTNPSIDVNHYTDVDLTHLEVGDGKYSTNPQFGYVYSCMTLFNGGGAQGTGNWMNGDGTWDATKKTVVDGSVTWPHMFTISIRGDQRVLIGNDLPDHPTGVFPVSSNDNAYAIDRNPNSIQEQSITLMVPANPSVAAQPNCVGGEVGIMLSGVVIFNAFDAEGRDAAAHEVQDNCDGHPQVSGFYHYHSLSDCIEDNASGHSALMGYAFDGFGIFGYYGEDGGELTNEDLDVCHGHTHFIDWDGQVVEMYHYHATHEFPYVVGCFHGTPAVRALSGEGQGGGGQQSGQGQPSTGGQPPQEAFDACVNLTVNSVCTVNTPNRTLSGTCMLPPSSTQLACVPAGGPP